MPEQGSSSFSRFTLGLFHTVSEFNRRQGHQISGIAVCNFTPMGIVL
jgi:hypothetical protein